jgi:hypothetical protein
MTLPVTLRRSVPEPIKLAWRTGRDRLRYFRGRNILRRYSSHYHRARRRFERDGQAAVPPYSADDFGARIVRGLPDDLIRLPHGHQLAVARVAQAADRALGETAQCRFFPKLRSPAPGPKTADLAELADRSIITIQLLDPFALDGVRELCEPLLEQIERAVYGSYAIVDKLYVYRNPISTQAPRASWQWHYDNHPREMIKVMVYLTDVSEDTAPFVYLRERTTGRFMHGSPLAPLYGNSRVPAEEIDRHLANGWEAHPVVGPRGTVLIFDDNIVHRATLARDAHRDVIVFQIRPSLFKSSPRIDPRWTGTFGHQDFHSDPGELAPKPTLS